MGQNGQLAGVGSEPASMSFVVQGADPSAEYFKSLIGLSCSGEAGDR